MNSTAWLENIISLVAGALVALTIGIVSHWSVGVWIVLGWTVLHGLTWGFASATTAPQCKCKAEAGACSCA
jgi:hypothetical protein